MKKYLKVRKIKCVLFIENYVKQIYYSPLLMYYILVKVCTYLKKHKKPNPSN